MDEKYVIYSEELTHHGIKGQKWGIRRFQNRDGSLTADGKRRRSLGETVHNYRVAKKRKANLKKAREAKAAAVQRQKDIRDGKIKVKDMTDAELNKAIERARLEKSLRDLTPKEVSAGKNFINNVIIPAGTSALKSSLTTFSEKKIKKFLGLDKDDPIAELRKEAEKLDLEKRIRDHKKDNSLKEEVDRLDLERRLNDLKKDNSLKEEVNKLKNEWDKIRYEDLIKNNGGKDNLGNDLDDILEERIREMLENKS